MSKKLTQSEFEQKIYSKYNGEFIVVGTYQNATTPIKIKHAKCGTIFDKTSNQMDRGCNCPKCTNNYGGVIIPGINDINTTNPYIASLLYNKEDGIKYGNSSTASVFFVCPNCNQKVLKKILNVTRNNILSCPYCSDGISYPNKFMYNLLKMCNIDFIPEYLIHGLLLDFYFEIKNKKYAIEMDGGIGHGNKTFYGKDDTKGIYDDRIKNNKCISNNIHLLRIDCNYLDVNNRFEYIKNNVLKSELGSIIDISSIDYELINTKSLNSIIADIGDSWNNGVCSYEEFAQIYNIKRSAIRKYLKLACEGNIIKIEYKELLKIIRKPSNLKIKKSKGHRILCEQTNEVFLSISDAMKKYNAYNIHKFLKGEYKYCGRLEDGTKLTWKLL